MEDNKLLMIVLAFFLGCMASQMMKSVCGGRLVEGSFIDKLMGCSEGWKFVIDPCCGCLAP